MQRAPLRSWKTLTISGSNHSSTKNKMAKRISYQLKLGIFVSIGLAIFILGIFWIGKQKHLFNTTFSLSAVFTNISGLQVGNNVRFSGINVGTVDNVSIINDTSVRVIM